MALMKTRKITFFMMVLATFCLFRAVALQAAEIDENDVEEVYEREDDDGEEQSYSRAGSRSIASEGPRYDVRLTRPEEARARRYEVFGEGEYEQVEGAERLVDAASRGNRVPASSIPVPERPSTFKASTEFAAQPMTELPRAVVVREAESPIPVRQSLADEAAAHPVARTGAWSQPPAEARVSASRVRGVQEVSVIASEYGFFPQRLFVTQGIPVKVFLTAAGKATSCFMVDGFDVKKGVSPGRVEEVTFLPERLGEHRFYCPVGGIEGKLVVRPAPADEDGRGIASER